MKRPVERVSIYVALIGGAFVSLFPIFWMVSTSVKVDRELVAGPLRLLPQAPSAAVQSPYVDTRYYRDLPGSAAQQARLLPLLGAIVSELHVPFPPGEDVHATRQQVARGLYLKLSRIIPQQIWEGPDGPLFAAARQYATADLVQQLVPNVDRRVTLGALRFRSKELTDTEPMASLPVSQRWENQTSAIASMTAVPGSFRHAADLSYNFAKGSQIVLRQTYHLPFPAEDLKNVQLDIRPDDSWHDLSALIDLNGQRWTGAQTTPLANPDWETITWQLPSDEDHSIKVKTWVTLERLGQQPGSTASLNPNDITVTLVIQQASIVKAWWNKLRLNYQRVLNYIPFWRYLRVSLFLVAANIVLTILSSSLAAYAFARLHWPGRDLCFVLMLATMMVPVQVLMIPQFLIWRSVGAYDTLTPLWLGAAFGNAFFIFLMRQFMRNIPNDLEDAARIDGCGFLRIYWHVMLPLVKPALAAVAIFTFIGSWNDFLGPLLYIADQRLYPIAFGLYAFSIQIENRPALTMAASVLMTVPIILVFLAAQKYFIQGITLTGLKG